METTARVIEDSVYNENRLTTVEVTFHRFVLAEFNTHRVFSRNSASSRAIPVAKQLSRLAESPAWPVSWPREHPGMQGGTELEGDDLDDALTLYHDVFDSVFSKVADYVDSHPDANQRLHKSVLSRLLEPFMYHTVVVSSTEWDNFFGLRASPLAQPEIRLAAEKMRTVYGASTPTPLAPGEWHLPYITPQERATVALAQLQQISVARCARVSSLHAGEMGDYEKDYRLFNTLTSATPPHASPLEHVATPCDDPSHSSSHPYHANFLGFHQLRHLVAVHPAEPS